MNWLVISLALLGGLLSSACNSGEGDNLAVLELQATVLAMTSAQISEEPSASSGVAPGRLATYTPFPTYTPYPTLEPLPTLQPLPPLQPL